MRILLLTQYFPPEIGAPQNRLSDLARRLAELGHRVVVLTAMPNYPEGRVHEEYRGRFFVREEWEGVEILRSWIFATRSRRMIPWISHYFSFVITSLVVGMLRTSKVDVVITESPPLFLGITGVLLATLKRAPFVLNVADLWPKAGVDLGILENPLQIRVLEALEKVIYRRASLVTGQTDGIVEHVRERTPTTRVRILPNGADVERFDPSRGDPQLLEALGLAGKFVVGYAGLHGPAQALHSVVGAAELLGDQSDVVFAFFGDGPERERLIGDAERRNLENVRFFPVQPADRMPSLLPCWEVGLVPLYAGELMRLARPSKLFELMASGVPVVLSAPDGEARQIVERAGAGIPVPPEDPARLADAIRRLRDDPSLRSQLGRGGRNHVERHFDRQRIAEAFAGDLAESLLDEARVPGPEESRHDFSVGAGSDQTDRPDRLP